MKYTEEQIQLLDRSAVDARLDEFKSIDEQALAAGHLPLMDFSELSERCALERRLSDLLPPTDPRNHYGYEYDKANNDLDLWWGGYRYPVDLERIQTPLALLELIAHVGGKHWDGATSRRIAKFIKTVCHLKKWDLYDPHGHLPKRVDDAATERAKLTPILRFRVLKRDGHKCRSCGAGPEHGAVLHIDHITPISRGGVTVYENLQTLCAACNFGKRAG